MRGVNRLDLELDNAPQLRRLVAEFRDASQEQQYRESRLEGDATRIRLVSLFGGIVFFAFCLSDVAVLGLTPSTYALIGIRTSLLVCVLVLRWQIGRRPHLVLNSQLIAAATLLSGIAMWLIVWLRPDELEVHHLSTSLLALAIVILVPNRLTMNVLVATFIVAGYFITVICVAPVETAKLGTQYMSMSVFLVVGVMVAHRFERQSREEFWLRSHLLEANERLSHEVLRRENTEQELVWLAEHDALTDLFNRRAFFEQFDKEIRRAQRSQAAVTVLVIDTDHFKEINDVYGHHIGDLALKATAGAIKEQTRAVDLVARIGGEEFAVVLPDVGLDLGTEVAERTRQAISLLTVVDDMEALRLTVSIGVVEMDVWTESSQAALQRADHAMYEAKLAGRDRIVVGAPVRQRST